jgi:hypothetical protein
MSGSLIERDKNEAKKKGVYAAAAWGGTVLLGAGLGASMFFVLPAAAGAGYLTYKWFMFRAKRGMRF